ncbi:MAG: zinc ribbon domain-containing protein [Clostridia bacterium]|nr:zinc ribbon domain-containing protein [Clostridia bacterium]
MKPCPHCGKELPQEMQFCPYCMEKLITETVIGDTPVRRRRRWWLWLIIALLLWLLLCGLWLWRPWQSPPAKKEDAASVGASTTTTAAASAASTASTRQTASDATATTTKHPSLTHATGGTSTTTHATTTSAASGVTSTTTRGSSAATSTTTRGSSVTPTASTGITASSCAAGHSWESITETVHVEEKGHYETKTVEKRLTLFRCALCYKEFGTLEDYYDHFDSQHDGDSLEVVFRDRYETFEEYREVEEQTWVVDTPAHDKTVTVGRRCRVCGKTEINQDKE